MVSLSKTSLIAPCGMNCGVCMAYLQEKNKCPGCRGSNDDKPITRLKCKIKTCEALKNGKTKFCFKCINFPCDNLKHLEKRYKTKYNTSLIENLKSIENFGVKTFLLNEKYKWTCIKCGGTICIHKGYCYNCKEKL